MTDSTTKDERLALIDKAVEAAGGIVAFAKAIGISHQAVYAWRRRGWVPFTRATQIEALYGIPRTSLVEPAVARALETPSAAASVL